eukprot:7670952-Prorocentrum_lima.AAC.1
MATHRARCRGRMSLSWRICGHMRIPMPLKASCRSAAYLPFSKAAKLATFSSIQPQGCSSACNSGRRQ